MVGASVVAGGSAEVEVTSEVGEGELVGLGEGVLVRIDDGVSAALKLDNTAATLELSTALLGTLADGDWPGMEVIVTVGLTNEDSGDADGMKVLITMLVTVLGCATCDRIRVDSATPGSDELELLAVDVLLVTVLVLRLLMMP